METEPNQATHVHYLYLHADQKTSPSTSALTLMVFTCRI